MAVGIIYSDRNTNSLQQYFSYQLKRKEFTINLLGE
ncbi:uncharacterized protein METZ01_LOCUS124386 [marine metagenome]|uniref:Uncharacterized protein n=1 Tax=marine metagenome TaxID=408172 RepID=A0A381Y4F9_9ZZZZ